ncbi:PaaI family thioesterase [Neobacillus bataviensis]|uniref:PaaI family thioesterase n=1 Tax=Neobacillus bataviensis TaxID=220685 RepID=UPI001CBF7F5E|nr:PaaI family thioesterase [Neobacillus bataviensis]
MVEKEIYKIFEKNPFFKHIGFEIVSGNKDEILLKLAVKKELLNTNNSLHGGVHASMLDMVQSIQLRTIYQTSISTVNLDVHYFAPVNTGDLFASAKILQQSYKLATIESEIIDENNQLIAKGTGVYKIVRQS